MLFRVNVMSLLAVVFAMSSMVVSAPVEPRQIGNLLCNIDRLKIVVGLGKTIAAVSSLATAGASDPAVTNATTTAQDGLTGAKTGIATIAGALLTGQTAPAAARTQVGDGLSAALAALTSINSTDSTIVSALTTAQSLLADAQTAGQGVVTNCK